MTATMTKLIKYLFDIFPGISYQSRLDEYLNTKSITDAAQLEHYIQQFNSKNRYI